MNKLKLFYITSSFSFFSLINFVFAAPVEIPWRIATSDGLNGCHGYGLVETWCKGDILYNMDTGGVNNSYFYEGYDNLTSTYTIGGLAPDKWLGVTLNDKTRYIDVKPYLNTLPEDDYVIYFCGPLSYWPWVCDGVIFGNESTWITDGLYKISFHWDGNNVISPHKVVSSDIINSETWLNGIQYIISGNIEIDPGVTLTIDPGTVIKFDTSTPSSLTVNGTLNALGLENNETNGFANIFFTSLKDDAIAFVGDTNGDGNATSPAAGDWGGITVNTGGSASFTYATVRYAGASGTSEAQIHNNGGTVTMGDKSYVIHGTDYGIKNTDGVLNVDDTDIGFHDYGVYVVDGTVSLDGGNIIHDNSLYGVYNADTVTINAENNFWGDPTGPYYLTNPGGLGNVVSGYVNFNPWMTSLHYLLGTDAVNGTSMSYTYAHAVGNDYTSELENAVDTWNNLGSITISPTSGTPEVAIENVNEPSEFYVGGWTDQTSPTLMVFNSYYLDSDTASQIQHTITHEFGHTLGLDHSYSGNVMYHNQTSQTALGAQDIRDYNYLW